MNPSHFYGTHTALITPFNQGNVDFNSLAKLIEWQLESGITVISILGTTGESPVISAEERKAIITFARNLIKDRALLTVGVGTNNTIECIQKTQEADELGADGLLVVTPYYNKPTQEGLFLHFSEIAKSTIKPIILYSVPARCHIEIAIPTLQRLRMKFPHIVGIKECGGSTDRVSEIFQTMDADFLILSGDDSMTLPFISVGARGVISVASNYSPSLVAQMVNLALDGKFLQAASCHHKLYPFFKNLFTETNPGPIKYCLYKAGIINSPELRLPLTSVRQETQAILDKTMALFPESVINQEAAYSN